MENREEKMMWIRKIVRVARRADVVTLKRVYAVLCKLIEIQEELR